MFRNRERSRACRYLVLGFAFGFVVSIRIAQDIETEIVKEFQEISSLHEQNSDVVARYSHYLDNHKEPVIGCPECGSGVCEIASRADRLRVPYMPTPDWMRRALMNLGEINMSLARLRMSLRNEGQAMSWHLQQLREGAGVKKKMPKSLILRPLVTVLPVNQQTSQEETNATAESTP